MSNSKDETNKYTEDMRNVIKNLKIDIPKIKIDYEALFKASENIGKMGWTIPFTFTLYQIRFLGDNSQTQEEIDTFFDDYYSLNENFDKMLNEILSINDFNQWHEAIKQSVYAHKNNMYILSIGTLIPVLEGILSTFESDKSNIKMMKVCKEMIDNSNENSVINKIAWISCYHFIKELYKKSDFSGKEPEIVNRHWILHGRTAFNNSKIDSIRIFNAIGTVSNIVKHYKRKTAQVQQ